MQLSYTKEEFHQFIIIYIREYLLQGRGYTDLDIGDDAAPWLYFIDELHKKGILSKLMQVKSQDDLVIQTDQKRIKGNIESTDRVIVLS